VAGRMAFSPGAANPDAERLWLKNQAKALQIIWEIVNVSGAIMITVGTISGERVVTFLHACLIGACWFGINNLHNAVFKVTKAIALSRADIRDQVLSANIGCRS